MENIAPPLELMMEVRFGLEKGQALRKILLFYSESIPEDPWRQQIRLWLQLIEIGRPTSELLSGLTMARRQCLELLQQGLRGEPVYAQVCAMEEEIFEFAKLEIEEFVSLLPIKSLIPLLFLQFPAFLALLIGPFLTAFLSQS